MLTEPLQLLTCFKNGNAVPGGSSQAHASRWACPQSRSPRVNGVPILVPKGLQDQATFAALKRRRPGHMHNGHGDNNFCMVGCRATLWYGAAGIAQHPLIEQCSML